MSQVCLDGRIIILVISVVRGGVWKFYKTMQTRLVLMHLSTTVGINMRTFGQLPDVTSSPSPGSTPTFRQHGATPAVDSACSSLGTSRAPSATSHVSATTSGFESASKGDNGQGDHNHEHKAKVILKYWK